MIKRIISILLIFLLSINFSIFAETIEVERSELEQLKKNFEEIDSQLEESEKLVIDLKKENQLAQANVEMTQYKLDILKETVNTQNSKNLWMGFAIGSSAVILLAGMIIGIVYLAK